MTSTKVCRAQIRHGLQNGGESDEDLSPGSCQCPLQMTGEQDDQTSFQCALEKPYQCGKITIHQSKTLICFHSFNLWKKTIVLSNKWFFTSKTPSEHKLAEKHNQPFQKTHVAVLSMISVNQNTLKSQSSSSECTKPPKSGTSLWLYERVEWIKITADKFQTQTICGHIIVFLKSCMETFTQLFYSYFTA